MNKVVRNSDEAERGNRAAATGMTTAQRRTQEAVPKARAPGVNEAGGAPAESEGGGAPGHLGGAASSFLPNGPVMGSLPRHCVVAGGGPDGDVHTIRRESPCASKGPWPVPPP